MRTNNPILRNDPFSSHTYQAVEERMTVQGSATKAAILLFFVVLSATYTWTKFIQTGDTKSISAWMIGGAVVGFISSLCTIFKKHWSPFTAPIYAVAEGFFLGGFSVLLETQYPGLPIQAVALTFSTLAILLFAYRSGLIQPNQKFLSIVAIATGALSLVYILSMLLNLFHMPLSFIHGSSPLGIVFSCFVVLVAALNLILDFEIIAEGQRRKAPKYMEWYGAFALTVTLVWLYIEMVQLLSKLRRRE